MSDNIGAIAISSDSKTYAFTAFGMQMNRPVGALYTIQEDGERMTRVAQSQPESDEERGPRGGGFGGGGIGSPQFSKDGRTVYYTQGNGIYSAALGGGGSETAAAPAAMLEPGRRACLRRRTPHQLYR